VVHYWAEELVRRGHQVTLITDTPTASKPQRGDSPKPGVQAPDALLQAPPTTPPQQPPEAIPSSPNYHILRRASFLQQWNAMRAADKIIMFNVSLKGLPFVLLSGKPLYISHHTALWYDGGPRPLRQKLKQWVANRLAKDNCACSAYIAGLYKKCSVIYSPYRADVFVPGNEKRIPGSILFAGRLVSDKGVDLLLEALRATSPAGLRATSPVGIRATSPAGDVATPASTTPAGDVATRASTTPVGDLATPASTTPAGDVAPPISLTIVGDGPDREKLEKLAAKLGLYVETRTGAAETGPGTNNGGYAGNMAPKSKPQRDDSSQPGVQAPGATSNETQRGDNDTSQAPPSHREGSLREGAPHLSTPQLINLSTVHFTGSLPQPQLIHLMQTHQIMVVPSRMEPMGMVVAEGLAAGCRMVVSHQGGMPEVGGPFCRYFQSGDASALAQAIGDELQHPTRPDPIALQKHLEQFTVVYSVDRLEEWLRG
jgi:glycosyltransferase involved in cell wall biosynthesis